MAIDRICVGLKLTGICASPYTTPLFALFGQVAQLVERGPEKAGVGGSIPSLATNNFNNLAIAKNIQKSAREQYALLLFPKAMEYFKAKSDLKFLLYAR